MERLADVSFDVGSRLDQARRTFVLVILSEISCDLRCSLGCRLLEACGRRRSDSEVYSAATSARLENNSR